MGWILHSVALLCGVFGEFELYPYCIKFYLIFLIKVGDFIILLGVYGMFDSIY